MANWCYNTVDFQCDEIILAKLEQLFTEMSEKEIKTRHGQLPHFGTFESGWLFETRIEGGILYYQTKWAPNVEVIKAIADHFQIDFVFEYEECGMQIFGEYTYKDGVLTDIFLDGSDYDLYEYDEENDIYKFEGEEYDSDSEILETLLERKKSKTDKI